jgi:hypothetical protein
LIHQSNHSGTFCKFTHFSDQSINILNVTSHQMSIVLCLTHLTSHRFCFWSNSFLGSFLHPRWPQHSHRSSKISRLHCCIWFSSVERCIRDSEDFIVADFLKLSESRNCANPATNCAKSNRLHSSDNPLKFSDVIVTVISSCTDTNSGKSVREICDFGVYWQSRASNH